MGQLDADVCESNTTIETHPAVATDLALQRARAIATKSAMPLSMLVVDSPDDARDTLELVEHH